MKHIIVILLSLSLLVSCKSETKEIPKENESVKVEAVIQLLEPAAFKKAITNSEVQLLDVRTPAEYEEGHIENALLIDFNSEDFKKNVQSQLDKTRPVYIYCGSGGRSAMASELIAEMGFTEIYDL